MAVRKLGKPVLTGADIVKESVERRRDFAMRDALYAKLLQYYEGGAEGGTSYEPATIAMNTQGRPMLRDLEMGGAIGGKKKFSSRRIKPIVDDSVALIGRVPNSRAEPPDQTPQGFDKSELLTKYLLSTHEMSRMDRQQRDGGWHISLFGDGCTMLVPDDKSKRVMWQVVDPRTAYPSFYGGWRRGELYSLLVVEQWAASTIAENYGDAIKQAHGKLPKDDEPEERLIYTYMSPFQRSVVVGSDRWTLVAHIEWDLNFCPAEWVFNLVTGRFGESDVAAALDLQDLYDFSVAMMADGLVFNTYPIVGIKNPQNFGQDQLPIGPDAVVTLGPDGDIIVRNSQGNPQALSMMIGQATQDIYAATGTSPVRQEGQMHGSIQTGRAIQATQGPQSTRVEAKLAIMAAAWQELNAKTLKMQEHAPVLASWSGDIYGRYRGRSFIEKMSAKDIDGNWRNTVMWPQMLGMNMAQKLQIAAEGEQFEMFDDFYARELLGIDDPVGMRDRVEAYKMWQAQIQAKVQGSMGGGGQQQAGSQAGPTPNQGQMTGGPSGSAGSQPAPMIARPFGMGQQPQQPQGGVPLGTSRKAVEGALTLVRNKLKGSVWALGDLAQTGQSMQPKLAISDAKDYSLVLEVMKGVGVQPKRGDTVKQMSESELPSEAVRLA